jgi:hypothetical protein
MATLSWFLLVALIDPTVGPALGQAPDLNRSPRSADLKIVFWYDRNRPLDTFHYQVYDLRAGEYTPEVDRWIGNVKARFPHYVAYARAIDLSRESGETEKLKTGSAIKNEFVAIGSSYGYPFGAPRSAPSAVVPTRSVRPSRPFHLPVSPSTLSPQPTPFPTPFPYPRPHP